MSSPTYGFPGIPAVPAMNRGVALIEPANEVISDFVWADSGGNFHFASDVNGSFDPSVFAAVFAGSPPTPITETGAIQNIGGVFGFDPTFIQIQSDVEATPLPSTWMMLLTGFLGLGFFAYRGAKKKAAALAAA